ncbi:cupin domain-containing protein [Halomarina oriensis]|uniref:Cupin domain-containing protein n=1 Tax=Halomarina oriensis TaxID=671145 RepID=A0A6B0GNU0_9EURY|nr:cupin domain-containing protein [Halomarina oriensis]MWG36350.1 cupin domain-containing protein [Halomarina oriensis]
MERVALDDVAPATPAPGVVRRRLSAVLGTAGVALVHYRVAPGDELPAGLHAHADQEEVFVVLDGTARFETLVPTDDSAAPALSPGGVTVEAGEAVGFASGEFQSGHNAGDTDLLVLAVGAPLDSGDLRVPVSCPDCDRYAMGLTTDGGPRFACPDCGCARRPTSCPECAGDDLRVRLGETRPTVVECVDCGERYPTPPVDGAW